MGTKLYAITTVNELEYLERSNAIVSVLLAEGYDRTLIEWIAASWDDLHVDSGMKWYIVVPCNRGCSAHSVAEKIYGNGPQSLLADYSTKLSRTLANMYGVPKNNMPVLLFDDFNEEKHQRYVSLAGLSEHEYKTVFKSTAALIDRGIKDPQFGNSRSELTDRAVDLLSLKMAAKAARKAASIASIARRLFG
jgi:hypothetical protein